MRHNRRIDVREAFLKLAPVTQGYVIDFTLLRPQHRQINGPFEKKDEAILVLFDQMIGALKVLLHGKQMPELFRLNLETKLLPALAHRG